MEADGVIRADYDAAGCPAFLVMFHGPQSCRG
jgi:hypothetical protein